MYFFVYQPTWALLHDRNKWGQLKILEVTCIDLHLIFKVLIKEKTAKTKGIYLIPIQIGDLTKLVAL